MILDEILKYDNIVIQAHDNPDADALSSAYGLWRFVTSKGKKARIVYSGRRPITKSNLVMMVKELSIPVEYIKEGTDLKAGILVTVDCQYSQGNVSKLVADKVAIIDHHVPSKDLVDYPEIIQTEIKSYLGSAATLVWQLIASAGLDVNADKKLATALYYGLMTDTNNFAEVNHPLDRAMQDTLVFDKTLVSKFINSNISLQELDVAGEALTKAIYDDEYKFGIINAEPCDPNILGFISDLALQVEGIDVWLVYNALKDGYKLSVRSCHKEVHADEFVAFLTKGIGQGGGHIDKSGGFVDGDLLKAIAGNMSPTEFFAKRIREYFDTSTVIYAKDYLLDEDKLTRYVKKPIELGYVDPLSFLDPGAHITISTLEGDIDIIVDDSFYVMIGLKGEVYPIKKEKFAKGYVPKDGEYNLDTEYIPIVHCHDKGTVEQITKYAKKCCTTGIAYIRCMEIDKTYKIFTTWDEEKYMLGKPGDYIAHREDDPHDIYIIERDIFFKTYEKA